MSIVVIGVGQTMRGDDGIGVIAVQAWQTACTQSANHPKVRVEISELPGLGLLEMLSSAEYALIVDAVHSGDLSGEIHNLEENAISSFDLGANSAHGWGVAETLQLGRKIYWGDLPTKIRIIGIEANEFNVGDSPGPEITEKLPQIVVAIEEQVNLFLKNSQELPA